MSYSKKILFFFIFFNVTQNLSLVVHQKLDEINNLPLQLQPIVNELKERNSILLETVKQENVLLFEEVNKHNEFENFLKANSILKKNEPNPQELRKINQLLSNFLCKYNSEKFDQIKNEVFEKNKKNDSKNTLILYGPPGTGKTTYIKKIAELSGSKLFEIKGPAIIKPYENKGSETIEEVFKVACEYSLNNRVISIIFIDEIDSFANHVTNPQGSDKKATQTLWLNMDDCKDNFKPVFVAFSTNNFKDLQQNFSQRIDYEIEILNPDPKIRQKLIEDFFKKFNVKFENNLKMENIIQQLVKKTDNLSIRDIEKSILESTRRFKSENNGFMKLSIVQQEINKRKIKQNSFNSKEKIEKLKSWASGFIFYGGGLIGMIYGSTQIYEYIKSKRNGFPQENQRKDDKECLQYPKSSTNSHLHIYIF